MNPSSLKKQTISSIMWTACQKFGTLFLSFFGNLILARFLTPNDYGLVGMLTIFISLSEVFIDSGFGSALIQKDNVTEIDYSTVFWINITISIFCYLILYICAPIIEIFYGMDLLKEILRVKGIILIIQSFRIIQTTKLEKELNFKVLSITNFSSALIATVISIVLAFLDFGVWSLVIKTLLESLLKTILLLIIGKWKPLFKFSVESFKSLFSYGGVMLLTSIVMKLYSSTQSLIIGKCFSAKELGLYTQATKLENIPTTAMESVVNQVTFPVFSRIKNEKEVIQKALKKVLINLSYVSFPLMIFFIVCAEPIFDLLYNETWQAAIPYFKYLCLVGMIISVNTVNTNFIKASGRKKEYFNLQVIKRIVAMIILVLSLKFGMQGLLISKIIIEYVFFVANGRITQKIIGYKVLEQIKDCLSNYILSFFVGVIVFFIFKNITLPNILSLLLQGITYFGLYLFISGILNFKAFQSYKEILFSKIIR